MKVSELMELLARMRKHQDTFFKTKDQAALRAARECERKLDTILERWRESQQQKLFK